MIRPAFAVLLLGLLAAPAAPAAEPLPSDPPIRQRSGILVDLKGRGLYTFDKDTVPGKSQCNNQCRLLWPPLVADDQAVPKGPFTVITRDDGSRQWAFKDKPLYRWASDKTRGDAGGERVTGWKLVKVLPPAATGPATGPAAPVQKKL